MDGHFARGCLCAATGQLGCEFYETDPSLLHVRLEQ